MKKLFKGFKAWLACLTRADEIYLVIDPSKEDAGFKVLIATYELDDAIEYMNMFNKLNTDKGPWLTKTLVH